MTPNLFYLEGSLRDEAEFDSLALGRSFYAWEYDPHLRRTIFYCSSFDWIFGRIRIFLPLNSFSAPGSLPIDTSKSNFTSFYGYHWIRLNLLSTSCIRHIPVAQVSHRI
jgi:hypothetical protein